MPRTEEEIRTHNEWVALKRRVRKGEVNTSRVHRHDGYDQMKRRRIDLRYRFLYSARRRAYNSKVPINIGLRDIELPETCIYLGTRLDYEFRTRGILLPNSATIDRIIPVLGYVRGNIQIISLLANRMKNNATPEELLTFASNILRLNGA